MRTSHSDPGPGRAEPRPELIQGIKDAELEHSTHSACRCVSMRVVDGIFDPKVAVGMQQTERSGGWC